MSTSGSVRVLHALARCIGVAVLITLAGCTDGGDGDQAATATPTAFPNRAAAPGGTATHRTTAPPDVRSTVLPTSSPANRPPEVTSISSVPDQVNPLDCTPPNPPERPEVTVSIEDPDDPVDALEVWLQYSSGNAYHGELRMRFDAKRRAFVATLPPVTRAAVGDEARSISISVRIPSSTGPPPFPHVIVFKGYCLGTVGNG